MAIVTLGDLKKKDTKKPSKSKQRIKKETASYNQIFAESGPTESSNQTSSITEEKPKTNLGHAEAEGMTTDTKPIVSDRSLNPKTTSTEIEHRDSLDVHINLGQSTDKPKTKESINLRQSTDKPKTNTAVSKKNLRQELAKPKTEPKTPPKTNLRQSTDKPKTNPEFSALVGLQRKILLMIFDSCRVNGSRESLKMTIESFSEQLKSPRSSVQKTIQRIEGKGFISRASFKNGRGGWTIYSLPKDVYQQMVQSETTDKLRTNYRQTTDKLKSEPKTEPKTTNSYSSSNILINNKTTNENELAEKVSSIKIPPSLKALGFGKSILEQVFEETDFKTYQVQNSLDAFAFDYGKNPQKYNKPIGAFVSVLCKKGRLWHSDELIKAQMAEYEAIIRDQEESEQKLEALKKKAFEIEFKKWKSSISKQELHRLVPPKFGTSETLYGPQVENYFRENIFMKALKG